MDEHRDVMCEQTGRWIFYGFQLRGRGSKRTEYPVKLGTFDCYGSGAALANAWLRDTSGAQRWEGEREYLPLTTEEEYE